LHASVQSNKKSDFMIARSKSACVIIADVMASRARTNLRAALRPALAGASRSHLARGWLRLPYAVTAGDEFQGLLAAPHLLPELLLDLRLRLRPLVLRVGAGVGAIDGRTQPPVNEMGGGAFVLARQAIEELKAGRVHRFPTLTAVRCGGEPIEWMLNLVYGLQDTLLARISPEQWRTIESYRRSRTMSHAAQRLKLSASTVLRNLERAGYWQIEEATEQMGKLLCQPWGPAQRKVR
jgi:hypothetical protein